MLLNIHQGGTDNAILPKWYLHMFIEILANMTQVSDVAPGPLVYSEQLWLRPLCMLLNVHWGGIDNVILPKWYLHMEINTLIF